MSLLLEIGTFLLGQKLADITFNGNELMEANIALKKEQLAQVQMENEILRLKMQIAAMEKQKAIEIEEKLSEPDEYDIEVMKKFAEIRNALANKKSE